MVLAATCSLKGYEMMTATLPTAHQSAILSRRSVPIVAPPEGHAELTALHSELIEDAQAIDTKRKLAIRQRENFREGIEEDPLNADCETLAARLRSDENDLATSELHLRTRLAAYLEQLVPVLEGQRRDASERRAEVIAKGERALAKAGFDVSRFATLPIALSQFIKAAYQPYRDAEAREQRLQDHVIKAKSAITPNEGSIQQLRSIIKTAALKRAELV